MNSVVMQPCKLCIVKFIDVMVSTVFMPFSKIVEDAEYGLWTVTLFRKKMEEFKANAREKK